MNALIQTLWLVPLYPLVAFILITLFRGVRLAGEPLLKNRSFAAVLTIGATALGLIHTLALLVSMAQSGWHLSPFELNLPWLSAGPLTLSVGYLVDNMSAMMLLVVCVVSLLVQVYTHGYMGHDDGYAKFYAYLALFNFSMLGLVLSTNLFQMYIFWELVGVSSYLLIGFWFKKPSAVAANLKAFLINRVGDFGLLLGTLGLIFVSINLGFWQHYLPLHPEQALLSFQGIAQMAPHLPNYIGTGLAALIPILIFMGPMAKSAQLPLHTWLPDAMEGPTPISALIHAATMVAAGVYLVARVYPLFQASETAMAFVAIVGCLTAVIAATIALVQNDIKKALAYSTVSQLGFMMTAMGVGAFGAALFHLFTHAFFKAMLFLGSGSVIHALENPDHSHEQDMRQMGGLWSKLPVTAWTYLIGTLAISGMLWTSGFWSKDEILVGAQNYSPLIFWALALTAGLTTFYMFRTFFLTFTGNYRGNAHVHHESPVMIAPLVVLAVPSLFIGALMSGLFNRMPVFSTIIAPPVNPLISHAAEHGHHAASLFSPVGNLSIIIGLVGFLLAACYYGPVTLLNADWVKDRAQPLYRLFAAKWYFDDIYQVSVDKIWLVLAKVSSWFDRTFIDGIANGVGFNLQKTSATLRLLQNGRVQVYVAVLAFGVVMVTLLALYGLA
jgi:NAD(P)H-quinone oxidoreductase subunit 5